jgi:signal transduction histidine kinase
MNPLMTDEIPLLAMKILVVDDEPANLALLKYILLGAGYTQLQSTQDPRATWKLCQGFKPDLILLDLMMPQLDGFGVMKLLNERLAPEDRIPILVLTADVNLETRHRALNVGASDFLTKPFDQIEVLLRIRHLLQIRAQHMQLTDRNEVLEDRVRERTAELSDTLHQLEQTVHQLRTTQQQVIQHERLSALGAMAAGLAHDFNNALSLILGYSELLQADLAPTPQKAVADDYLGIIIEAAQDAAKMFGRLRGFYRPAHEGHAKRPVNLNSVIEQAVALTKPRWHGQALSDGATVNLDLDLAPEAPVLMADGSELREMLTNLIFNAVDAMPEGGTLRLHSRLESGPAHPEGCVLLEVADTGTGMTEETRRRCLEPFFTTKGEDGTGLGLAMVYGTVQRHGGLIELRSAPGEGTAFIFRLPLQPSENQALQEALTIVDSQPLRVLAVDDQPVFLEVLQRYLTSDWHTVETAGNGEEALEKFRVGEFDLVITDKAMPGMSGEALAEAVKAHSPRTQVILLTGFGGLGKPLEPTETAVDLVVQKPITNAILRACIAQVMARRLPKAKTKAKPHGKPGVRRLKEEAAF